jgi:hypothetical protein
MFVEFSRGLFDQQDILGMEATLLRTIGWKVNPPTSSSFVPYLLDLLAPPEMLPAESRQCYPLVHEDLRELARYLCELAVCLGKELDDAFPSEVAFASLVVAMELLAPSALPPRVRTYFCETLFRLSRNCRPEFIEILTAKLMATLWPEMLLDDNRAQVHEPSNPVSLARYYGPLDLRQIQKQLKDATPPSSPMGTHKYVGAPSPRSPFSISTPLY